MIKSVILVVFMVFLCQTLKAQGDHLSIGIGPSLIYSDNSGLYRKFKFQVRPAATFSYNKQVNDYLGLRGSLGVQFLNSGYHEDYDPDPKRLVKWGDNDQAFGFKGSSYFADVMPMFITNPNAVGMIMSSVQFFAGLGFGVMLVQREQEILKNGVLDEGALIEGDIIKVNETNVIPYIPIRTGISTNSNRDWDFALEFVLMVTTNSELDGNNIRHNQINPDMSGQILFTVKRYIGSVWY